MASSPNQASVTPAELSQTVVHLQSALVSVMDETEGIKKQLLNENAKLQREFRETVDVILANQDDNTNRDAANVVAMEATLVEQQKRLGYMEEAVSTLKRHATSQDTPTANAAALQQTRQFIEKADAELLTLKSEMQKRMENIEQNQSEQMALATQRELGVAKQISAYREEQQKMQLEHLQRITNVISTTEGGSGGKVDFNEAIQQRILSQVEALVASEVRKQVQLLFRTHQAEVNQQLVVQQAEIDQLKRQLSINDEMVAQLEAQHLETSKEMKTSFETQIATVASKSKEFTSEQLAKTVASQQGEWSAKNTALMLEIDEFVREYCNGEFLASIKDAIGDGNFGALNSPSRAAAQQLHNNNSGLRDIIASSAFTSLQDEVASVRSRVDTVTDDMARMNGLISQTTHACTRAEQSVTQLRGKIDVDMKSEFQRAEQLQKAFFQRQEQLMDAERANMSVKVQTEAQLMRTQLDDAILKADQRRAEEIVTAREQLQSDYTRSIGFLREEVSGATKLLTEKCDKATASVSEAALRTVNQAIDTSKRTQQTAFDEVRRVTTKNSDELTRLKSAVDDNSSRLQEQNNYLHVRLQAILDDEVQRIDRMSDDISLRLNQQIETEVKRVVTAADGGAQRDVEMQLDSLNRDAKTLRDELNNLRTSLHHVAAPSVVLDSLEKRLEVQRLEMVDLHETVSKIKAHDQPSAKAEYFAETSRMVEKSKNEVLLDVGTQLQRFDLALVELSKEQHMTASMVERNNKSAQNNDASLMILGGNQSRSQTTRVDPHHSVNPFQPAVSSENKPPASTFPSHAANRNQGAVSDQQSSKLRGHPHGTTAATAMFVEQYQPPSPAESPVVPERTFETPNMHSHPADMSLGSVYEGGHAGAEYNSTRHSRHNMSAHATPRPMQIPHKKNSSIGMSSPAPPVANTAAAAGTGVLSPMADADILMGAFAETASP